MPLTDWESFYVIVGSSAAALTGLMFVVIALIADTMRAVKATDRQIDAFGTPTVVHFGAVLLQSAILSAPWPSLTGPRLALGLYGSIATIYTIVVMRRARRQDDYHPVLEDWLFHGVLPLLAYASVVMAAIALMRFEQVSLFIAAGASALLLFIGIHNAWDTVTYIVLAHAERTRSAADGRVDETRR